MGTIRDEANEVYADGPTVSPSQPPKSEIRALFGTVEDRLDDIAAVGVTGVRTRLADVAVATTANITLSGEQTIDGVLTSTSRILVKDQSSKAANGIYVTAAGAWSRATDADTTAEIYAAAVLITGGTVNAGRTYWCDLLSTETLGTDAHDWIKIDDSTSAVGAAVHGAAEKSTLADNDEIGLVDSAASNVLKHIKWSSFATAIGVKLGVVIAALTAKTTPVDADTFVLSDSEAAGASKKLTWANVKATIWSSLGALIAAGTEKEEPVGADMVVVADSAATNASKKVTLASVKALVNDSPAFTGTPTGLTSEHVGLGFVSNPIYGPAQEDYDEVWINDAGEIVFGIKPGGVFAAAAFEGIGQDPAAIAYNDKIAVIGDSRTASTTAGDGFKTDSWMFWLGVLARQRYRFKFDFSLGTHAPPDGVVSDNYGVGGFKIADVVAAIPAMLAATDASTIIIGPLGQNDFGVTPIGTMKSGIDTAISLIHADRRRVILIAEVGAGDASFPVSYGTSGINDRNQLHQYVLDKANGTTIFVADPRPYWVDPTSTLSENKTTVTYDGVHPVTLGAHYLAKALLPIIEFIFPPRDILPFSNGDAYDATHNPIGALNANPMLSGTGGDKSGAAQMSGELADDYFATSSSATGATIVASKVTGPFGEPRQRFVISGTPTGSSPSVNLMSTVSFHGDVAAGDVLEAFCEIEVEAGMTGIWQVMLSLYAADADGEVANIVAGIRKGDGQPMPGEAWSGVLRVPRMLIPDGVTLTDCRASINIKGTQNIGWAGAGEVGRLKVRKVIED